MILGHITVPLFIERGDRCGEGEGRMDPQTNEPDLDFELQPAGMTAVDVDFLAKQHTESCTPVLVRPSWGNCTTNNCQPPGKTNLSGLAACAELIVKIPAAAIFRAVRLYSTAQYPNDVPIPELMPWNTDKAWSWFDGPPGRTFEGQFLVIRTQYHNRCSNRFRQIRMEVDYEL